MGKRVFASLVIYKNDPNDLINLLESFVTFDRDVDIFVADNSPNKELEYLFLEREQVRYYHLKGNIGFGAAHNFLASKSGGDYAYHMIVNPDTYFHQPLVETLCRFVEENTDVGIVMPRVSYPDGSLQYLCKRFPTPFDLIIRRFVPDQLIRKRSSAYEMRGMDYETIFPVESLSGCFMFMKSSLFETVGGFDVSFFMYLEDVDLCKRVSDLAVNYYNPSVEVFHKYEKGSYRSWRLLFIHIKSAISYFNKHGWFPFW